MLGRSSGDWVHAPTIAEGYKTNVRWGLGTFNNKIADESFIYSNRGHGFVDPLTGILLWIGVALLGIRAIRRRADEGVLLALVRLPHPLAVVRVHHQQGAQLHAAPDHAALRRLSGHRSGSLAGRPLAFSPSRCSSADHRSPRRRSSAGTWPSPGTSSTPAAAMETQLAQRGDMSIPVEDTPGQKFFLVTSENGGWDYYSYGTVRSTG